MVIVDKWFTCMSVLWLITGFFIAFGNLSPFVWDKISDGLCYMLVGVIFGFLGVRYGEKNET